MTKTKNAGTVTSTSCRTTLDQNLDLQMQALRKAGCKNILREKLSGTSRERPEFQRCSISSVTLSGTVMV